MEVRKVLKRTKQNVDNRIQYVGQIASEGKHSKKLEIRNEELGMTAKE